MKQTLKEIGEILIAIDGGAEWEYRYQTQWGIYDRSIYVCLADGNEIRLKPRTIRIGEYDVPEPLRVEPVYQQKVFVAAPSEYHLYHTSSYMSGADHAAFKRGLIHTTAEAAALHGKALASLTSKEPIE